MCLANGYWPLLRSLTLYGNDISVQGVELLMAGVWPMLQHVTLESNSLCAAVFKLLDLVHESTAAIDIPKGVSYLYISRAVSFDEQGVWPSLEFVQFKRGGLLA